jgi:hypothetical protein
MKADTKLAIRKWAIRTLRKLVWRADEWIHRQEMALREVTHDLSVSVPVEPARTAGQEGQAVPYFDPFPQDEFLRGGIRGRHARRGESKRPAKAPRRRMTAAEFDLRFAR